MPKSTQTTTQLHSSNMLVKQCSKFSKPGFSNTRTMNFQMFKLVLEKVEIKLPTFSGSSRKQESSRKTYFCFTDYTKAFDSVNHIKLWKILQEMGISDHLTCLLRNLYAGQEATVRTRHGAVVQFSSVAQLSLTLCNPMDCRTPDFPVRHQFLELTQTNVH